MKRLLLLLVFALPVAAQDIAQRPFERDGFAALNAREFTRCASIFSAAAAKHRDEPSPAFAAARCYAGAGDTANARKYVDLALARGYRNCTLVGREFPDAVLRCEANAEAFVRESNPELLAAYLADRGDRSREIVDQAAVMQRDATRQKVVRIAIARRTLRTADDYFHAAWVMHHGSGIEDIALARELTKRAVELRPSFAAARWLYASSTDRHLQLRGKPQIYGTQYQQRDGKWTLEPFDANAVTDEERARWRVRSVAEMRQVIDRMNGGL